MSEQALTTYTELADLIENLPLLIRERRRSLQLNLREVGERTGMANSTIWRIEHGQGCSLENLVALLRWLDGAS